MLFTVKSPRRKKFTTDCREEACDEAMKRWPKVTVLIGTPPLQAKVDVGFALMRRPEDGRHHRPRARERFLLAVCLAEVGLLSEADKRNIVEEWFAAMSSSQRVMTLVSEEHAVETVLDCLLPLYSAGEDPGPVIRSFYINPWAKKLRAMCWDWLASVAGQDREIDAMFTRAVESPETVRELAAALEQKQVQ